MSAQPERRRGERRHADRRREAEPVDELAPVLYLADREAVEALLLAGHVPWPPDQLRDHETTCTARCPECYPGARRAARCWRCGSPWLRAGSCPDCGARQPMPGGQVPA